MMDLNLYTLPISRSILMLFCLGGLNGVLCADDNPPDEKTVLEEMSIEELAERKFPGLQVERSTPFVPADTPAELRKQLKENDQNIKRTRLNLQEVGEVLRNDQAFQEVLRRQNEYAASVAEANKRSNGKAGIPDDFYEKLKVFREESSDRAKEALGKEGYLAYQAENARLQVYYRRAMALRSALSLSQGRGN